MSSMKVCKSKAGPGSVAAGFTLIEVLVVITIVAVLVALLIPSISQARQVTRDKLCMARMRQIYQVSEVYRIDWKLWYPANQLLTTYPNHTPPASMLFALIVEPYLNVSTQSLLAKSMPDRNMLMCPSSDYRPGMALAEARLHIYPETRYGNYWVTARFGYNPSSVTYPMRRDIASGIERTIFLGEVRGTTYTRFGHNTTGPTNVVYNHSLNTTNMVTADGRIKATAAVNAAGLAADDLVIQ